jgi:predicted phage terminase large subunit-like protein
MITSTDYLNFEREFCARSLLNYTRRAWHILEPDMELKTGWALECICEHLEAITRGEIVKLLINVPPGLMKSLLSCVLWPSWEWGPKYMPDIRFIGASHDRELATRDSLRMRRLIQSDWYQKLWPVKLTGDQNKKTYFENDATGWRVACAATAMTGWRADRVAWDDPQKTADADSAAVIEEIEGVFKKVLPTRLNDPIKSARLIIMQKAGFKDASSHALNSGYYHVMLPMEFDKKRACVSSIYPDPRTEDGELLFPERFPKEAVDGLKIDMGSMAYATQCQQLASPPGGNVIKTEWWLEYDELPKGMLLYRRMYCDTALKTKESSDYSVFAVWGKAKNGNLYLIDVLRGKWEAPELERQLIAFWDAHKSRDVPFYGPINQIQIEDKASGTGLIQGTKRRGGLPIVGTIPEKDKYTRVKGVLPYIEGGMCFIPRNAPWKSEWLLEHEQFTGNGRHDKDDQVDTTTMALSDMAAKPKHWMEEI